MGGVLRGPKSTNAAQPCKQEGTLENNHATHAVQKTMVLSHQVLRVDVNCEYGQMRKVGDIQLKMQMEDLARYILWG